MLPDAVSPNRIGRVLDWSADHVGDVLFLAFAAIVAVALLVVVLATARTIF